MGKKKHETTDFNSLENFFIFIFFFYMPSWHGDFFFPLIINFILKTFAQFFSMY